MNPTKAFLEKALFIYPVRLSLARGDSINTRNSLEYMAGITTNLMHIVYHDYENRIARYSRFLVTTIFKIVTSGRMIIYHRYFPGCSAVAALSRLMGKKVVFENHGDIIKESKERKEAWIAQKMYQIDIKILSMFVSYSIALTCGIKRIMIEQGFRRNEISVVHNAIKDKEEYRRVFNASVNDEGILAILFIGAIEPWQDLHTVIEVMQKYQNEYCLYIIGNGSESEEIRETIERRKLKNVKYLGYVSDRRRIESIYNMCHFGILPLTGNRRLVGTCAIKLLEYLLCGKVVIATMAGELIGSLRDKNILFTVGENSTNDWERIFNSIKGNLDCMQSMRSRGRKYVLSEMNMEKRFTEVSSILGSKWKQR